jgi:5'-3' exonuclease
MEDIYTYQSTTSYDQEIYENMIQNLPLLDLSQEKDILHNKNLYYENKEEQINDSIQSLIWCTHYYFKGCIHWKWSTKYGRAPFLQDLSQQLQTYSKLTFEKDDKEFIIQEQLNYIFPQHSHQLHSYDLSAKSYTLIPDTLFRRYLWECDIDFITENSK